MVNLTGGAGAGAAVVPMAFQSALAGIMVRKGALTCDARVEYRNDNAMLREEIIRHIVAASGGEAGR